MRTLVVLLALTAAAAAQDGTDVTFAPSGLDVTAGGTLDPDIACAAPLLSDGVLALTWFDRGTRSVYRATASGGPDATAEVVTALALATASGAAPDDCLAATAYGGSVYVALAAGDQEFVMALRLADPTPRLDRLTDPATGAGDGIVGLHAVRDTLYAAARADRSAPASAARLADGFYRLDTHRTDQSPTPFVLDDRLSLRGLSGVEDASYIRDSGDVVLLSYSDGDGGEDPAIRDRVVRLITRGRGPEFNTVDPLTDAGYPDGTGRVVGVVSTVGARPTSSSGHWNHYDRFAVLVDGPGGLHLLQYATSQQPVVSATGTSVLHDLGRSAPEVQPLPQGALAILGPSEFLLIGERRGGRGADEVLRGDGSSLVALETDPERGAAVSVSPNPAAGRWHVRAERGLNRAVLDVVDPLGRTVAVLHDGPVSAGDRFDVSGLAPGAYFVRLRTPGGVTTRPVTVVR